MDGLGDWTGVGVAEASGVGGDGIDGDGLDGADAGGLAGLAVLPGGGEPFAVQPLTPITSTTDAAATMMRRRPGPRITPTR